MKLMDMKQDDSEEMNEMAAEGNEYPYGLTLHLDSDTCEKLGISMDQKIALKDAFHLEALALVTGLRQDSDGGCCMDLQIVQMGMDSVVAPKSLESALYGEQD